MTIAEKKARAKTDYDEVYEAGKFAILDESEYMHPTVSGSVISANDVNALEHSLGVRLESKNLFNPDSVIGGYVSSSGVWTESGKGEKSLIIKCTPNTYYTISFQNISKTMRISTFVEYPTNNEQGTLLINSGNYFNYTFNLGNSNYVAIWFYNNAGETYTLEEVINGLQLELGTTATEYTPYISDFSGVNISRYGKNLFNNNYLSDPTSYVTQYSNYNYCDFIQLSPNTTYTLSHSNYDFIVDKLYYVILVGEFSGTKYYYPIYNGTPKDITFTTDDTGLIAFGVGGAGYGYEQEIINNLQNIFINNRQFQLELGTTATEYEPYKESQTAITNADGTVEGLTSLSPNMTLITDTDGVVIDCQYYRDIDTYIDNLITDVAISGGE